MANIQWTTPPERLEIEPGWVHLFRLRLDLPETRLTALQALLSPEEQARARRYLRPRDGSRFTAARGQLRKIIAGYTQNRPESVIFQSNSHGKPSVPGGPAFNLSHSAGAALLAVGPESMELGADIEKIRPDLAFENMARRFFAPGEVAALLALPEHHRITAFYACWTRKEAYMKARGLGLAIPLDGFEVSLAPGEPPRLLRPAADDPRGADWRLFEIDPGVDYAGALAVLGEIAGIRCWEWGKFSAG